MLRMFVKEKGKWRVAGAGLVRLSRSRFTFGGLAVCKRGEALGYGGPENKERRSLTLPKGPPTAALCLFLQVGEGDVVLDTISPKVPVCFNSKIM